MGTQKTSLEEALKKLEANPDISLVQDTYVAIGKKARFIDKDYGEFETRVCDAIAGRRHPQWWIDNKKKVLSEKNRYSIETAQSRMPEGVEIDRDSYRAFHRKCWLTCSVYGKFWSSPKEVAKAGKSLHPKNKDENNGRYTTKTDRILKLSKDGQRAFREVLRIRGIDYQEFLKEQGKKGRDAFRTKYGVNSPFDLKSTREKSKETCLDRYGQESFPVGSIQESKGEKELKEWIEELGFKTEKLQDSGFEIDVFIPELKVGIEFNGIYWHSDAFKHKSYHSAKSAFFYKKDIRVIHIFECFWVHRKEQVKNFLRSAVGRNTEILWARKCIFKTIPWEVSKKFCNKNHIQGSSSGTNYSIGVFSGERLLAVAQFGAGHRQNNAAEVFLKRLCFEPNVTIVGAMSKIAKIATEHYGSDIYSFVDLSISQGSGYGKSGWERVKISKPDYFYSDQDARYISKQSRKKSIVKTPEGMTELEHARIDKLFRIWDCGKIKMIFRHKKKDRRKKNSTYN